MISKSYFNNLDINELRTWARNWVEKFDYIQVDEIQLYAYNPSKFSKYSSWKNKIVYAVVFRSLEKENEFSRHPDKELHQHNTKQTEGKIPLTPFQRLSSELEYFSTIQSDRPYKAVVTKDFKYVYREGVFPGSDYLDEWIFIPLELGKPLPLEVDDKFGVALFYRFFGYSEFIEYYEVEDPNKFYLPGLQIRKDGVWVETLDKDAILTSGERAVMTAHPHKNLTIPALSFPCSHKQIQDFFKYYSEGINVQTKSTQVVPIGGLGDSDYAILQYGTAAKRLYDRMCNNLNDQGKNLTASTASERKQAAVRAFSANSNDFSPLKREQVDVPNPYEANEKYSRKMIGTIIMSANIPGAESNYQELYSRFLSLKPSK